MVKKVQKADKGSPEGRGPNLLDKRLASNVKDSAQQIWLAGMGAFARAQAEGGKVFEALMKEGLSLQRKTQGMAEDKINEVTGRMSSMAGDVTAKAGQHWDKLEAIFEARTAKAMSKLGVPTARDVEALIARVDELAAAVARLSGQPVAAAAPRKRSPAAGRKASSSVPAPAAEKTSAEGGTAARKRSRKPAQGA